MDAVSMFQVVFLSSSFLDVFHQWVCGSHYYSSSSSQFCHKEIHTSCWDCKTGVQGSSHVNVIDMSTFSMSISMEGTLSPLFSLDVWHQLINIFWVELLTFMKFMEKVEVNHQVDANTQLKSKLLLLFGYMGLILTNQWLNILDVPDVCIDEFI